MYYSEIEVVSIFLDGVCIKQNIAIGNLQEPVVL
jgi:hypothetical protein